MSRTDNTMPYCIQDEDARPGQRIPYRDTSSPVSFGGKSSAAGYVRKEAKRLRRGIRQNERARLHGIRRPSNVSDDFDFMPVPGETKRTALWNIS